MQLKAFTGADGNKIEACTFDHLPEGSITIIDTSCQMERTYCMGETETLGGYEKVLITSREQVMQAWESGLVWF